MRRGIIKRIPAVLALLLLCAIVYFYVDGWFDVSFIVRSVSDETTSGTQPETSAPDDESSPSDTTSSAPQNPVVIPPNSNPETPPSDLTVTFPDADSLGEGYSLSYKDWIPGASMLAEAHLTDFSLPNYFTSHKITVNEVSYVVNPDRNPHDVVYTPVSVDAPAVTLYMGYIIAETDAADRVNIYASDGTPLGSYDTNEITPAYCRDRDGRPLFLHSDAYYYLDAAAGKFAVSDYDPIRDNRGVLYDYTPDYGTSKEDGRQILAKREIVEELIPVEGADETPDATLEDQTEDTLEEPLTGTFYVIPHIEYSFALADSEGTEINDTKYPGAFNFSDSLAAVLDEDGYLSYITRSGATAINSSTSYMNINLGRTVIEFYVLPLTNGPESVGFYFFEHGLARARLLTVDKVRYNNGRVYVVSDENILITSSGEHFYIPLGYEIESYSSGMILLHGESGYGYMDYTGTWVVDPTLDEAETFYEGLAVVCNDGQYALIDTTGNTVIPFGQFSYISNASSGVIAAYDGEWHVLYKMEES